MEAYADNVKRLINDMEHSVVEWKVGVGMAFVDLCLLKHYKTYKNNIVKEFYALVVKCSHFF